MPFLSIISVAVGGAVGAVVRYLLGLIPIKEYTEFPVITLLINVVGAFIIGILTSFAAKRILDENLLLLLKVGFCGSFTTFSTFSLETTDLIKSGHWVVAILYIVLSILLSVAAVFGGSLIAEKAV